ncbi:MAG: LamG domain-containing protein [Myxococcales bacterium]|nr:LamG domain-containing protein [Myxococcales bacterium]
MARRCIFLFCASIGLSATTCGSPSTRVSNDDDERENTAGAGAEAGDGGKGTGGEPSSAGGAGGRNGGTGGGRAGGTAGSPGKGGAAGSSAAGGATSSTGGAAGSGAGGAAMGGMIGSGTGGMPSTGMGGTGMGGMTTGGSGAGGMPSSSLGGSGGLAVGGMGGAVSTIPTQGLVVYYPFDETGGNTVFDASGNANNGTLKGQYHPSAAPTWQPGHRGNGLQFGVQGPGYVETPASASLDAISTGITVAAWVKLDESKWQAFVSRWSASATYSSYQLGTTGGDEPPYRSEFLTWSSPSGLAACADNITLPPGVWIHLAGTHDGTTAKLYKDGQLLCSSAKSFTFALTTRPLLLGMIERDIGAGPSLSKDLKGTLDEVRIYNRALSDADVMSLLQ